MINNYTGGISGQVERLSQISKLKEAPAIIGYLAGTGYKLDDYWDEKGSIGKGDIEVGLLL